MPVKTRYHSSPGGFDMLGLRQNATGGVEIIYDDGVKRRLKWRVCSPASEGAIGEALRHAVNQTRVLPALYSELKRRSIAVESISS
ncbi:hypothetical protein DEA8626_01907 [Defluviimonas aquaemixtae]|uniref:KTSC domain-containing protein n=1 Tax=Albidovulum aquaemixtae TaxID=1542388 RepID=A0A2R8B6X7_9RHOB|nr:hypothetical protein [Defluviimonas aquaemixtae]SPH18369.1 hypothetical protein DEA8626_01907 [Defluviimonas aquaemixtae]